MNRDIKLPLAIGRAGCLRLFRHAWELCESRKKYVPVTRIVEPGVHVYFGYYDHSPVSSDGRKLLALHADIPNRMPRASDAVQIGYYDMDNLQWPFTELGESSTWCWQQGCRLQWYPRDGNELVSYNRIVGGKYGCVVQNVTTKTIVKELLFPVYDIAPDGSWGLGLNFSRLHRFRPGYGYVGLEDSTEAEAEPANDGIWRVDFTTGKADLLFSIADAAKYRPVESMRGAEHYFNHISINPAGDRFLFFHLWQGTQGRQSRLITCDRNGRDWRMLKTDGIVSHYTWKNESIILVSVFSKDTGVRFHEYNEEDGRSRIFGSDILRDDGHPSYSPDGRLIIVDTYPDPYRDQHLYLFDESGSNRREIGRFYSPFSFRKDLRCDLHPRWSPSGQHVCVDVPGRDGYRLLAVIKNVTDQLDCSS